MELFENSKIDKNILPYDGEVFYYGNIIAPQQARDYLSILLKTIAWKHDEAIIFGKHIITKRMAAWYGDQAYEYTYSKITKKALPWTPLLLSLKELVEKHTKETFNSCLLNLYHDGSEGMSWHSDGEKDLKKNGCIASLSFGAERKFAFKHKETKETIRINLANGSLLVMQGNTQDNWLHQLPTTKKISTERINLTFRTIA